MRATVHQKPNARDGSGVRIISVQPDRDHAFVEVIGRCGHEGVGELRQRVDGLLMSGARFVLVDLTRAGEVAPSAGSALAAARRQLTRREGWLRTVGHQPCGSAARFEASLLELFTIYQAVARNDTGGTAGDRHPDEA